MTAATIYSQGYRRYEGPRTGTIGALKTLTRHSIRESLGLGRGARHKVLPVSIIVMVFLPAVVFVGVAILLPAELLGLVPNYSNYYGYVIAAIYLFAGLIGPELLCPDRRTGMLGVYLASPLSRPTYLAGKGIATFLMLSVVTLGSPLMMLIAFSLQGSGPESIGQWLATFGRISASSAVIGVLYSAIALAISSSTDRKSVAAASILGLIPGSNIVAGILVDGVELSSHLRLLDMIMVPRTLIVRIHDDGSGWPTSENPTYTLWLVTIGLSIACLGYVWARYRQLTVRR